MINKKIFNTITNGNIKRRNFILYGSIALAGIVTITKFPFKLFNWKTKGKSIGSGKIKINSNPDAVKRDLGIGLHG